jgi:hypothetical protein
LVAGLAFLPILHGCASTPPAQFFQLEPEAPAQRAAETRYFETRDMEELLSASAAVLQDLGFHVEESARDLGFLRAAKERSARTSGQLSGRAVVMILSFGSALLPIDLEQRIAATLVARPTGADAKRQEVRIMFYRVVWKGDGMAGREYIAPGEQRTELIRDAVVYREFFARLSKAVFLEAFTL